MTTFNFSRLIFPVLLCLLPITLFAAQSPRVEGSVYDISNSFININDMQFPLLSTAVALAQPDNQTLALKDIKKGDYVRARLRRMNNRFFVDMIERLPENLRKQKIPLHGKSIIGVLSR